MLDIFFLFRYDEVFDEVIRLNINNVTHVNIDYEHIMSIFRISTYVHIITYISYIIINQNIMRHYAINHS